ncbi:hypothetical protein PENTCL1PPCAC_9530 [Pristionchus entomophagus]|uniref:Peptidase M12A domain-containing protein n=1 Tax=Pristionchus entomophagus TaxID=358040 RepID=A0AAV5SX80_9BILA|nr:hypothetical protein PENTCL1PPCAC_9530 [Pristionchus entomophagus]
MLSASITHRTGSIVITSSKYCFQQYLSSETHKFQLTDRQNNNFGVSYDFGSVLHYGAFGFSTNGQPVLVAPDYINTMGQRKTLTFNDYKMINSLYDCTANCTNQMVCLNGGYTSPRNCNVCICNDFFTGTNCETSKTTIAIFTSRPGRTAFHQDYNRTLFLSGNNYNWDMFGKDAPKIIRAPVGKKIKVTINKIYANYGQLECYEGCPFVGLQFVDNVDGDLTTMGRLFCCAKDEKTSFVSKSNIIGYKAFASPGMAFDGQVTYTVV